MLVLPEHENGTTAKEGQDVATGLSNTLKDNDVAVRSSHETGTLVNVTVARVPNANDFAVQRMIQLNIIGVSLKHANLKRDFWTLFAT